MAPTLAIDELVPHAEGVSAPIVTQIAAEDKVKCRARQIFIENLANQITSFG